MKRSALYTAVAVLAVVAILVIGFAVTGYSGGNIGSTASPTGPNSSSLTSSGSTFTANSIQGGNQTYVATLLSTIQSAPTTTTTSSSGITSSPSVSTSSSTTTISTSTSQSQTVGNSYSYSVSSQVKILSVEASVSGGSSGDPMVTFSVQYQNIGSSDIYVLEGGGSNLDVTITSGASLIQQVKSPMCEIAIAMISLGPGDNATAVTPGCWSGFQYQLLQAGNIQVQMTLGWSNGTGMSAGSIQITADFALG